LEIEEGDARAVVVPRQDSDLMQACFDLRARDYVARGWVAAQEAGADRYDDASTQFAVLRAGALVATVRSTPYRPDTGFMLEREFATLIEDPQAIARDPASVEVSRLASARSSTLERIQTILLMFRLWTRFAAAQAVRHVYFVMSDDLLARLGDDMSSVLAVLRPLGPPKVIGTGGPVQAMVLDLPNGLAWARDHLPPSLRLV
jgi:N-acyl-L-homoserine lactone synthetase